MRVKCSRAWRRPPIWRPRLPGLLLSTTAAAAVFAGSCATGPVSPALVEFSGPSDTVIAVGGTAQYHAIARDGSGNEIPEYPFTWTSSDPAIATVDQRGTALGIRPGAVEIQVRNPHGATGWALRVTERAARVVVAPDPATLLRDGTLQLAATPLDSLDRPIPGRSVTWSSDDTGVAVIDGTGLVTGVAVGSAQITATVDAASGTGTVNVVVVRLGAPAAGGWHSCAAAADSITYCWGLNSDEQLGDSSYSHATPAPVLGGLRLGAIVAGAAHTCGLTATGEAYCWGSNRDLQLGSGSAAQPIGPVAVAGGLRFASLSAGSAHTCGVTIDGDTYCWGDDTFGQLGAPANELCGINPILLPCSSLPLLVSGELTFQSVSAGGQHTCGLVSGGAAYCWGENAEGQFGDGTGVGSRTPVPAAGGLSFTRLSAGRSHTCGVAVAGGTYCWGDYDSLPVPVADGLGFTELSAGADHTCGLTVAGAAYCWGHNEVGQLGDGSTTSSPVPVAVAGGLRFVALSAGMTHTCGLATDGRLYCWGDNSAAQLGTSTTETCVPPAQGKTRPCSSRPVLVASQP